MLLDRAAAREPRERALDAPFDGVQARAPLLVEVARAHLGVEPPRVAEGLLAAVARGGPLGRVELRERPAARLVRERPLRGLHERLDAAHPAEGPAMGREAIDRRARIAGEVLLGAAERQHGLHGGRGPRARSLGDARLVEPAEPEVPHPRPHLGAQGGGEAEVAHQARRGIAPAEQRGRPIHPLRRRAGAGAGLELADLRLQARGARGAGSPRRAP